MSIADFLGKQVKSPDTYTPDILRTELRSGNREQYGIDESFFEGKGYDIWNNWEVSFLLNNGKPVTGIAKILFDAAALNLVESKSLKLYFNSFNMQKLADTEQEAREKFVELAIQDLSAASGRPVQVVFFTGKEAEESFALLDVFFNDDNVVSLDSLPLVNEATKFNEAPELLQTLSMTEDLQESYHGTMLRSNCKITHAPDTGDVYIRYETNEGIKIADQSLLEYLLSFRKENHFHEECCEMIYKRLLDTLKPKRLLVACFYNRRGSLDINPIRFNDRELCADWIDQLDGYSPQRFHSIVSKTIRQ